MWRHLLTFLGGQGMVVLALTFLSRNYANVYMMYVGEGKDEKLSPNAVTTSRSIWRISMLYLVIGTIVMSALIIHAGLPAGEGILHGMWIFMSAWSTGGFAPMSQNMLYYHDLGVEVGSMIFFLIGSFNFALHYAVMRGHRSEIRKNIETVTFTITLSVLTIICITGLMQNNVYPNFMAMFRKGFYLLASGHTTTGFMSVYAKQFFYEWGDIALFAIITAMLFGGSACSTAGGFKALRIGIVFKAVKAEISRMLVPDSRIRTARIHHIRDMILSDSMVKSAALIILLYILTFAIGMLAGMYAGYPAMMAAFESASVTGNVGLSIGITAPSMPAFLKITYLVIMWLGRLEFMSVFTLIAYAFRRLKRA
jgi:trk system potassium uptake protein TrkH